MHDDTFVANKTGIRLVYLILLIFFADNRRQKSEPSSCPDVASTEVASCASNDKVSVETDNSSAKFDENIVDGDDELKVARGKSVTRRDVITSETDLNIGTNLSDRVNLTSSHSVISKPQGLQRFKFKRLTKPVLIHRRSRSFGVRSATTPITGRPSLVGDRSRSIRKHKFETPRTISPVKREVSLSSREKTLPNDDLDSVSAAGRSIEAESSSVADRSRSCQPYVSSGDGASLESVAPSCAVSLDRQHNCEKENSAIQANNADVSDTTLVDVELKGVRSTKEVVGNVKKRRLCTKKAEVADESSERLHCYRPQPDENEFVATRLDNFLPTKPTDSEKFDSTSSCRLVDSTSSCSAGVCVKYACSENCASEPESEMFASDVRPERCDVELSAYECVTDCRQPMLASCKNSDRVFISVNAKEPAVGNMPQIDSAGTNKHADVNSEISGRLRSSRLALKLQRKPNIPSAEATSSSRSCREEVTDILKTKRHSRDDSETRAEDARDVKNDSKCPTKKRVKVGSPTKSVLESLPSDMETQVASSQSLGSAQNSESVYGVDGASSRRSFWANVRRNENTVQLSIPQPEVIDVDELFDEESMSQLLEQPMVVKIEDEDYSQTQQQLERVQ